MIFFLLLFIFQKASGTWKNCKVIILSKNSWEPITKITPILRSTKKDLVCSKKICKKFNFCVKPKGMAISVVEFEDKKFRYVDVLAKMNLNRSNEKYYIFWNVIMVKLEKSAKFVLFKALKYFDYKTVYFYFYQ